MDIKDLIGLAGVPVIVALVQVAKGFIPDKRYWAPVAVVAGVALNVAAAVLLGSEPGPAALIGMVAGLAASGLYSGGKAIQGQ